MTFGLGDLARARGRTPTRTSTDLARRLTQHLRRLDEHRSRIDLLEHTVDDLGTEVGEIGTRLAAIERRLVELHVAVATATPMTSPPRALRASPSSAEASGRVRVRRVPAAAAYGCRRPGAQRLDQIARQSHA